MGGGLKTIIGRHADPLNIFSSVWEEDEDPSIESNTVDTGAITQTPTEGDASVALAAENERRKRAGYGTTVLTSGLGATGTANTDKKTLG